MAPIGPTHISCLAMLNRRLVIGVGDRGLVAPQITLPLDARSAPEPDLTVLGPRDIPYRETWVHPRDVLLLIEVSGTSLRHDLEVTPLAFPDLHVSVDEIFS